MTIIDRVSGSVSGTLVAGIPIAVDFVERLQAAARTESSAALFVRRGLIVQGDELYLHDGPDNVFCSVTRALGCSAHRVARLLAGVPCTVPRHARRAAELTTGTMMRDRVVDRPLRAVVSTGRTVEKNAFLALFGKERLDAVKERLQAQRG